MAKGKGFDIKALLLNHGEKFGAGLIGVLALAGLATANWSPCQDSVDQLAAIANKTREDWRSPARTLPEENREKFAKTPDVERLAARMASPNEDVEQFQTIRHWNEPINRIRDKIGAVVVLPPETPESTLVTFALLERDEIPVEEDLRTGTEKTTEEKSAEQQRLDELFGKTTSRTGGAGPGAAPGYPGLADTEFNTGAVAGTGMLPGGGASSGYGSMMQGRGMNMGLGMGADLSLGDYGGYSDMDYGYGSGSGKPMEKKVRYHAGVSVRMVFDLRRQTQMLAEALRVPASQISPSQIDFVNLDIQRKSAVPGPDPWAGEWEPLTLDEIGDVLERAAYIERDIVNPSVIRSEITMPLPSRAAGRWTLSNASHKRLEEFKLSDEEQELIDRHQAKLLDEANRIKAMLPPEQARNEGFRRFGLASQDLGMAMGSTNYMNAAASMYGEYQDMNAGRASTGTGQPADSRFKSKEDLEKFLNSTLVANRLLLVRFMDFTCNRGNTYKYRVRLVMRNPSFNLPVDELEQPELATQQTIVSAWSQPTEPVSVPRSYRYYTQKVDAKVRSEELAHMTMLYQHETAGTPVMGALRVPVGVRIGGKVNLEVVDLGKSVLETQEVELKSLDYLAGVAEGPRVSQSDFPELRDILRNVRAGTRVIPDRITVVDSNGAIVNRFAGDKVVSGGEVISESSDQQLVKYLLDQYKSWRPSAAGDIGNPYGDAAGEMSSMMGFPGMAGAGGMMDGYMGSSAPGSSLGNRNRSSRRNRGSGDMGSGYPGAGGSSR